MTRKRIFRLGLALPLCWVATAATIASAADDGRLLAPLPAAAQAVLQAEMRDSLRALNGVLELLAADKVKEAGALAEKELGVSTMGRHRDKPFDARPGPHMPPAMHRIGIAGHEAASAFANAAASGDRSKALAALPAVTGTCVSCHSAFRIR